jgi:hypothetical protein
LAYLKKHVKSLIVKLLCETRWECRIYFINAIKNEILQIINALIELTKLNTADHLVVSEVNSLIQFIERFDFLVLLCFWQDILSKVNLVSNSIQSSKMDIRTVVLLLDNCTKFLQDYKITGYTEDIKSAEKASVHQKIIVLQKDLFQPTEICIWYNEAFFIVAPWCQIPKYGPGSEKIFYF